jgi:hypothetical protein
MKNLLLAIIIILGFISCEKESADEASQKYCTENMKFTCTDSLGAFYFKGKINGDEFCVSEGLGGYTVYNGVATETTTSTSDPTFTPGFAPESTHFWF